MISLEMINPHMRFARELLFYFRQSVSSICLDCRLFYIQKGNGSIKINDTQYDFSAGTIIYLPPTTKYFFTFENYNDISMLVFNFDLTKKYSHITKSIGSILEGEYDENVNFEFEIPAEFEKPIILFNTPQFFNPLSQCINIFFNREPFFDVIVSAKFKLALIELLKESPQFSYNSLVLQVIDYIHTKCNLSFVTPNEIAEHFNYHPYYLSQIMKKNVGKTLQQYLTHHRIKTAKIYLTTSNLDISFIGGHVGFNSTAYFIKVFKETTGQTPMQYRKSHTYF